MEFKHDYQLENVYTQHKELKNEDLTECEDCVRLGGMMLQLTFGYIRKSVHFLLIIMSLITSNGYLWDLRDYALMSFCR